MAQVWWGDPLPLPPLNLTVTSAYHPLCISTTRLPLNPLSLSLSELLGRECLRADPAFCLQATLHNEMLDRRPLVTHSQRSIANYTIEPFRVTQSTPQEFSGVTEVQLFASVDSLRISWRKRWGHLAKREKTRCRHFSLELRFLDSPRLCGVIGCEIITRIQS